MDLGRVPYGKTLQLQLDLWEKVKSGGKYHLLLLEHDPVITLGRRTDPEHLLKTEKELREDGIELFQVDRGGSATYHGPGQLVGYIICKSSKLGGIHQVVTRVLRALHKATLDLGIDTQIDTDNPGIWMNTEPKKKLAAVGMQNKMGVTLHGFAINVDMLLTGFTMIVPCGLQLPVSTLSIETGRSISLQELKSILLPYLKEELLMPENISIITK